MEEITCSLWSKKRSQPRVDCSTVHKDLLKDEERKRAFLSSSFTHMFVFVLENQGEPCWHIHPLWEAGRG